MEIFGSRGGTGLAKKSFHNNFVRCSIYAWGTPLIYTAAIYSIAQDSRKTCSMFSHRGNRSLPDSIMLIHVQVNLSLSRYFDLVPADRSSEPVQFGVFHSKRTQGVRKFGFHQRFRLHWNQTGETEVYFVFPAVQLFYFNLVYLEFRCRIGAIFRLFFLMEFLGIPMIGLLITSHFELPPLFLIISAVLYLFEGPLIFYFFVCKRETIDLIKQLFRSKELNSVAVSISSSLSLKSSLYNSSYNLTQVSKVSSSNLDIGKYQLFPNIWINPSLSVSHFFLNIELSIPPSTNKKLNGEIFTFWRFAHRVRSS